MGFNLDIGCGKKKFKDFIGMDKHPLDGVDIVHDIEETPWPMDSGEVELIHASHVLEHIKPWKIFEVINEAWRVLAANGAMNIKVPFGIAYRLDPSRCIEFSIPSFWCFDKSKDYYKIYETKPWIIIHSVANQETHEIHVIMQKIGE